MLLTLGTLAHLAYRTDNAYLFRRTLWLGFLTGIPTLTSFLYVFGINPIPSYGSTPFIMSFIGVGQWFLLFRYNVFVLRPIAREAVFTHLSDGILVFDADGDLVDFNPAAAQYFGPHLQEKSGKSYRLILDDPEFCRWYESSALFGEFRRRQGNEDVVFEASQHPIREEPAGPGGRIVLVRDITARVKTEQTLRASEIRNRELMVTEIERQRIGRDLHDDLGQKLTGIRLQVETLQCRLAGMGVAAVPEAETIQENLCQTIREARALTHGLNPIELHGNRLWYALKEMSEATTRSGTMCCQLHPPPTGFYRPSGNGAATLSHRPGSASERCQALGGPEYRYFPDRRADVRRRAREASDGVSEETGDFSGAPSGWFKLCEKNTPPAITARIPCRTVLVGSSFKTNPRAPRPSI
jgi:PAS domain S-box-containing protein